MRSDRSAKGTSGTAFDGLPPPSAAKTLGWSVRGIDVEASTLEVGFEVGDAFLNPAGTVQGGFLAAMLDDTMGPVLFAISDGAVYAPTIDLNVSFIREAKPGRFTGRGRVVNQGRTIAFLEGELFDADGELVARGTATARVMDAARKIGS
jgi:uncharacterized protein (TIGR00369 family)